MTSLARRTLAFVLAGVPALALSQTLPRPDPIGEPATTVYRQVMPDGRIVYSDKPVKGAKIDETISADPDTNSWTPDTGKPPAVPPRVERTPVSKAPAAAQPAKARSFDDANADVIRAEMLLEDAKKRREAGIEPLPGERTGNVSGGSRLNETYQARQRFLADEVSEAEAALRRAVDERNALRHVPAR